MANKYLIILLIPLVCLVLATPVWAPAASSTYRITLDTMDNGAVIASSGNYALTGRLNNQELGKVVSANLVIRLGFYPGAFEVILAPIVVAIDPGEGLNIAPIQVKISGANFANSAVVKLKKTGLTDIVGLNTALTSNEINCEFNLAGVPEGVWDVVVRNPNGNEGSLPSGFKVKAYPLPSGTVINSPNPFNPAKEPTTIMYNLPQDTNIDVYLFSLTGDLIMKKTFNAGASGGKAGANSFLWAGISDLGEGVGNGLYLLHVVDRSNGKTLFKGKIAILRR